MASRGENSFYWNPKGSFLSFPFPSLRHSQISSRFISLLFCYLLTLISLSLVTNHKTKHKFTFPWFRRLNDDDGADDSSQNDVQQLVGWTESPESWKMTKISKNR